ncbi:hydrogenase maturation protease [bacterium]|nr:hydrogenase maturation protease [bacterium]
MFDSLNIIGSHLGTVLVGVGNDISGDDAFGPELARKLKPYLGKRAIDAGLAPENWTGPIIKLAPSKLIIADAVAFDEKPGKIHLFKPEELIDGIPATHGPGLGAFIAYIRDRLPDCEISILAVQPAKTGLMVPMSNEVIDAIEKLVDELKLILSKEEI